MPLLYRGAIMVADRFQRLSHAQRFGQQSILPDSTQTTTLLLEERKLLQNTT